MSKNIPEIPFTELVERVSRLARVSESTFEKVRGVIQDVAIREIPSKYDWNFLLVSSGVVTTPEYKTGTCSVNTDATAVTFSSDVALTAGFTGRKIKFTSNDAVYDFTFSNATGGTIRPALQGTTNISNGSYTIFQPVYALANDFDRFPKDGGLYLWQGGSRKYLEEDSYRDFSDNFASSPGTPDRLRIIGADTTNTLLFELNPAPNSQIFIGYDYYKRLRPLFETTQGLILSISANATVVTGHTTTRFAEAQTGDWFRVDALGKGPDSLWYRIIAIANDSSLTLQSAFANTAITSSANYTIARAPEMPAFMHPAVLYGTLRQLTIDQNDPNAAFYHQQYGEVLSDGKRLFVTRTYSKDIHTIAEEYWYRY